MDKKQREIDKSQTHQRENKSEIKRSITCPNHQLIQKGDLGEELKMYQEREPGP